MNRVINDDFLKEGECYDRALLPLIICLGRLRIASKYIFDLWQLRQGVDSLAQWLEHWIFIREDLGSIPTKGGIFFQLCFIPLLRRSCRKVGARPRLDFIRRKCLHVIINDDFLKEGECYDRVLLPSIICLGRLRIASKYIFDLWQLRQGVDSLAQWLEYWIFNLEDQVRFPGKTEYFFSHASFLCYGYHVVRQGKEWWRSCAILCDQDLSAFLTSLKQYFETLFIFILFFFFR